MKANRQIWIRMLRLADPEKKIYVMSKDDLDEDIHVFANRTREKFGDDAEVEIFEWEDDLQSAAAEAQRRSKTRLSQEERHQGTLHDWIIAMFLTKLKKHGSLGVKDPAPLSAARIKEILENVKEHPAYEHQTVSVPSSDGKFVFLKAGRVTVAGER
jgi:hypothetical protein